MSLPNTYFIFGSRANNYQPHTIPQKKFCLGVFRKNGFLLSKNMLSDSDEILHFPL